METSALHSQVAVFYQEDNCLYFALGLVHAALQVQQALKVQPSHSASMPSGMGESLSSPQDQPGAAVPDDLGYLLLGVFSFSRYYLKSLEGLNVNPVDGVPTPVPADDLLRPAIHQLLR